MEYISEMPGSDNPPIFGLHPNADLTFSLKDSLNMINTMLDTQPKDGGGGGGLSREDTVKEKIEKELMPQLPPDINPLDTAEKLRSLKGPKGLGESGKYDLIPLNIFLSQEL
jgi:dynein heavy chain